MIKLYIFIRSAFMYSYSCGEFHKIAAWEMNRNAAFNQGGIYTLTFDEAAYFIDTLDSISDLHIRE